MEQKKIETESLQEQLTRIAVDFSKAWDSLVGNGKGKADGKIAALQDEVAKHVEKHSWALVVMSFGFGLLIGHIIERKKGKE